MWKHSLLLNMISIVILLQAEAQDTIRYSKPKIIDSSDLRWDSPFVHGKVFISNSCQTLSKLRFSKNFSFQTWTYLGLDSTIIEEGTWSIKPSGWLVLTASNGTSQKYSFRTFANFRFLIRDDEVRRFEVNFLENLGGRQLVKGNGRILDKNLIDACWALADRYYMYQE